MKFFVLTFGFCLFATGCTQVPIVGKENIPRKPTQVEVKDPQFSDVTRLIKSGRADTVEDFLRELKRGFPYYFDSYTLMYDSFSLQEASYQDPRAVLFGQTAKLIMTFNGSNRQRGYCAIEMMEYTPENGFRFREVSFLNNKSASCEEMPKRDIDMALSTPRVKISKPNTARCTSCHSENHTRPIWEDYFMWPGAYGSEDDRVYRIGFSDKVRASLGRAFHLKNEQKDPEVDGLARFQSSQAQHPRYSYLGDYGRNAGPSTYGFSKEPHLNFTLSRAFVAYSFEQLAKKIVATPAAYSKIFKILSAIQCDYGNESAEKAAVAAEMRDSSLAVSRELVSRTRASFKNSLDTNQVSLTEDMKIRVDNFRASEFEVSEAVQSDKDLFQRAGILFPKDSLFDQLATVAITQPPSSNVVSLKMVLKEVGINLSDYAVNLRRNPSLSTGYSQMNRLVGSLIAGLKVKRPAVNWDKYNESTNTGACESLKEKNYSGS